jgi:putative ubiquitin-RnfH superfamily antitoxin RatB of RatAB toxin-antitoxin module
MNSQNEQTLMRVAVVLAMPDVQPVVRLEMKSGSTVKDAIEKSGLLEQFEGIELDPSKVGIFGSKVSLDRLLREGDRVEIYRALIADPKEVRRQRALEQAGG